MQRLNTNVANDRSPEQRQEERTERAATRKEQESRISAPLANAERIALQMQSLAGRMSGLVSKANQMGVGTRPTIGGPPPTEHNVDLQEIEEQQSEVRAQYRKLEIELGRALGSLTSLVRALSPNAQLPSDPSGVLTLRRTLDKYWNVHVPTSAADVAPAKSARK